METSRYFERTLFYDRSPTADEFYQRSADHIFEKDAAKAEIEVRYQQHHDPSRQSDATGELIGAGETADLHDTRKFEFGSRCITSRHDEKESPSKPPLKSYEVQVKNPRHDSESAPNQDGEWDLESEDDDRHSVASQASSTGLPVGLDHLQGDIIPPSYPGPPQLTVIKLNLKYIKSFVDKTKHDFRVFYIRQRHSHSRIQITKQLFEELLTSCNAFPRFNEYLVGFGSKQTDNEVGPPPLKFRALAATDTNAYRGFGNHMILESLVLSISG